MILYVVASMRKMSELFARTGMFEIQSFLTVVAMERGEKKITRRSRQKIPREIWGKMQTGEAEFREKLPDRSQEYGAPRESTVNIPASRTRIYLTIAGSPSNLFTCLRAPEVLPEII